MGGTLERARQQEVGALRGGSLVPSNFYLSIQRSTFFDPWPEPICISSAATARIHSPSDSGEERQVELNRFASDYSGRRHKRMVLQFAVSETAMTARNSEVVRSPAFRQIEIAEPTPQLAADVVLRPAGAAFAAAASQAPVVGRMPVAAGAAAT